MNANPINYDEEATVTMLAALLECPQTQQLDTLAAVCQIYIELIGGQQ